MLSVLSTTSSHAYLLLMLFDLEITTFIHMTRLSSIDQLRARRAVA
jgi:hypothetical protein